MKRNILTIFLASPGDLQVERKIVRNTISRVNEILSRRVGWYVELLGWEDTLPGASRPQALINKDVDSCELFIGMLWRRWGQDTGEFSSGFEEEFIRAQERRKKTGLPEMWLFFKAVDEESVKDPGEQLKRVLSFKEEQIQSKEIMFKEFDNAEHWTKIILDNLLQYVLDLTLEKSESESREEALLDSQARELNIDVETKDEETYPVELVNIFSQVSNNLKDGKPSEINMLDRTRLYLQSSAWFSEEHLGEVFGTHEINLAYNQRSDWELSNTERWFLIRSFISDKHDHKPGWYWLKEWEEGQIDESITLAATRDMNINVRRAAFLLLADIGFKADPKIIEKGLSDKDTQVILQAIRLLQNNESSDYLELVEKVVNNDNSDIREAAIKAKINIIYLSNHDSAFSHLIESGVKITPLIQNSIQGMSLDVDNKLLFEALKNADASVRRFAAQYLRKSSLLTKAICHECLKDTDAGVRKEGLLELINLNEDIEMDFVEKIFPEPKKDKQGLGYAFQEVKANDFLPLILRKQDPKHLLSQLDFFSSKSEEAYRILSENHFSLMESRIKVDLDEAFDSFRKDSEVRFRAKYGFEAQYKPHTMDFLRDQFIAAAMDGLAKNGQSEDIKYARKYLGHTKYNIADKGAIILLSKFGDSSDVEILLEAAKNNYGEIKKIAVKSAYNLSEDKEALLEQLINDKDDSIAIIGLQILSKQEVGKKIKLAQSLFNSETDKRRVEALSIVINHYNASELEKLLDDYISKGSYYYNVVTWLDRILYSKGKYLNYYKSKLYSMIK